MGEVSIGRPAGAMSAYLAIPTGGPSAVIRFLGSDPRSWSAPRGFA
jgi:hypothetical protein